MGLLYPSLPGDVEAVFDGGGFHLKVDQELVIL